MFVIYTLRADAHTDKNEQHESSEMQISDRQISVIKMTQTGIELDTSVVTG